MKFILVLFTIGFILFSGPIITAAILDTTHIVKAGPEPPILAKTLMLMGIIIMIIALFLSISS